MGVRIVGREALGRGGDQQVPVGADERRRQAERLHAVERAGQPDRVERAERVTRGKIARPAQERACYADDQVLPLSVEQEVVVQLGEYWVMGLLIEL